MQSLNNGLDVQACYQEAIKFATAKHLFKNQKVPGTDLPYVVHLSNVAMEILIAYSNTNHFNLILAIQVALLHDTMEDTDTTFEEIVLYFGQVVADGVAALTKNNHLPKEFQMEDSLKRIREQPKEIWAVKLADRITNLQAPPKHWSDSKRMEYRNEAMFILQELKDGNQYLATRLELKIDEYQKYYG